MRRLCRAVAVAVLAGCTPGKPEVPILNYHSVGTVAEDYTVPLAAFEQQLGWIAAQGLQTISLHDLAESRAGHAPLPRRAVILTFDDGREDALRLVLPALRAHGMRATFFIVTGWIGKPGYLTWDGVRALAGAGMEIGSHTVTHPRLPDLPPERVEEELRVSRQTLEKELGRPVEALAYPYNSVRRGVVASAQAAGYRLAVAGGAHGGRELFWLLRIPIAGSTTLADFERAILGG